MENQFVEINPNIWKYENDGDSITGVLIDKKEEIGPNKSKLYSLEVEQKQVQVWGTTILDDRMNYTKIGDLVKITYRGTKKNSRGQDTKIFKVEVAMPKQTAEEVVGEETLQ